MDTQTRAGCRTAIPASWMWDAQDALNLPESISSIADHLCGSCYTVHCQSTGKKEGSQALLQESSTESSWIMRGTITKDTLRFIHDNDQEPENVRFFFQNWDKLDLENSVISFLSQFPISEHRHFEIRHSLFWSGLYRIRTDIPFLHIWWK